MLNELMLAWLDAAPKFRKSDRDDTNAQ